MDSTIVSPPSDGRTLEDTPDPVVPRAGARPDPPAPPPAPPAPGFSWKTAGLCVLAFLLVVYDALNLGLMIELTPKNDFGRTFLSGVAFVHGRDMYAANDSIPWELDNGTVIELWNLNPPHFHLLLLPLAWLPVGLALVVWMLANAACGLAALRLVVREAGLTFTPAQRQLALLGLLGFIGTGSALVTGHLSFLLFWVVALAWRAAGHGRWTAAGVWLGLGLSLKPFLLILVPYLAWRRQWRSLGAVALTVLACLAAGYLVFGPENHRSWRNVLAVADTWAWLPMNASLMGLLSRTFADNPMFTPLTVAPPDLVRTVWLCLGIPMGLLSYAAAFRDGSRRGVDRAFALLLVGALLLSPLGWTYYCWLPLGPAVLLAKDWWRREGGRAWSRRLLRAAAPGLVFPLIFVGIGQPPALGTVLFSSAFFWGLLLVWLALLIDGLRSYLAPAERTSP
jgi:hypothetical protein